MKQYLALTFFITIVVTAQAQTAFISGPLPFSKGFGSSATVLPNGNYVVDDSLYGDGKGAVHLYNDSNSAIRHLQCRSHIDGFAIRIMALPNNFFRFSFF